MINAYHVTDALPAAMVSIFALWAIGSTWHWFLRTSVVAAALLLPLFVPAYEIVIQFGIQVVIIVCGLSVWRWRRNRALENGLSAHRSPPQLSLRDALLLTAVLAVNLALLVNLPELTWYQWIELSDSGAMSGLVTLCCAWLVLADVRPAVRWTVVGVMVPILSVGITLSEIGRDSIWYLVTGWRGSGHWQYFCERIAADAWTRSIYWAYVLVIAVPIICAWLYLAVNAGWHSGVAGEATLRALDENPRRRSFARRMLVALSLAVMIFPSYVLYRLMTPRPYAPDRSSMPAGLDELSAAGEMIGEADAKALIRHNQMSNASLAAELAKHETALAAMHQAIAAPVERVPRTIGDDSPGCIYLFHMVEAKIDMAKRTNILDQLLDASLDSLRLTDVLTRDDLDSSEYISIQEDAVRAIWTNREGISTPRTQELATALWELDQRRIPWQCVETHRKRIAESSGWQLHLQALLDDWSGYDRLVEDRTGYNTSIAELRVLFCDLAVRAFHQDHRRLPLRLEELVPDYLPEIPHDPFNEKALRYERVDGSFLVYSVGPDLDDDGGKALDATTSEGDITSRQLYP